MSFKNVMIAILNMVFRLSIACLVVIMVYRLAMYSYHFGYMVFADAAKEISPGRDVTISVTESQSTMEVAKVLENRGLIDDAKIFYVQEKLSEYHDKITPGVYTLNTSMKANEMLSVMAQADAVEEEEEDASASTTEISAMDESGMSEDGMTDEGMSDEGMSEEGASEDATGDESVSQE